MRPEKTRGAAVEATVTMCSMRAGDRMYGIDTHEIREVLGNADPRPVPLAASYIAGVLPYRGEGTDHGVPARAAGAAAVDGKEPRAGVGGCGAG